MDRAARVAAVKALYSRLRAGALGPEDLVPLAETRVDDVGAYLERMARDREAFDQAFGAFGETYDVFRIFGADATVLDVGAHWGYSAMAMRHQDCRASIIGVEAMPFHVPALERLAEVDLNYRVVEAALSDVPRELVFHVPVVNGVACTGLSSTGGTLDDYFAFLVADLADTYPAAPGEDDRFGLARAARQATTLDAIVAAYVPSGRPVAALKVDVEGHEAPVLAGGAELFSAARPLLMLENANRDPAAVEIMVGHGYFHCERRAGRLVARVDFSYANDGFWVHPEKAESYRAAGLFEGPVPSPEEAARPVAAKWNARDGFVDDAGG
jgi:FkbM family methyltransferase